MGLREQKMTYARQLRAARIECVRSHQVLEVVGRIRVRVILVGAAVLESILQGRQDRTACFAV
jgi:hypothetical protein